jgi:hypothetical protein
MTQPHRIDFISGQIEVVEAIAFDVHTRETKPRVVLRLKENEYKIHDRYVMWRFLDLLDNEKFYYNSYLNVTNEVPLEIIINDFLHDYPNTLMKAWVEDGIITGFDGSKKHNPQETAKAMEEIANYINLETNWPIIGVSGKWSFNIRLAPYRVATNTFQGLVATYIQGNKIIEVISRYQLNKHHIYISGRYSTGLDFIQPLPAVIYNGRLATIPVGKLYNDIDALIRGLKVIEEKSLPELQTENMAFRLNIQDRNKLEYEKSCVLLGKHRDRNN